MKQITLTVNGKEITAPKGQTILEVVDKNKLDHIPTLCNDSRIEPYGSCFLCVVEVAGMNRLVPSCCTPAADGMEVVTDNASIRASRKTALELLLSNHYADCIGPCIDKCPAHVDAQGYIALMDMGKYSEALQLIKQQNPLPLSIGRVCVRDCETACRREKVDEAVAINHLKRYAADMDAEAPHMWAPLRKTSKNKPVAVVGGGPSGLTCAYYLTLEGYSVTIFEKQPRLGGMLMYGIPEYRLPKELLDRETQWITKLGIKVETNTAMGRDFDVQSLLDEGFQSVFIAVGAHKASTLRLEHENDTPGIIWGIDFLRQLPQQTPGLQGHVVVVGGGNTAIDAARTALRCGADKVSIVYRRSIEQMPAHHEEIHAAQEEGIDIRFLTNPSAIIRDSQNRLTGIRCLQMKLEEAAPGQRPRPVPIEGSQFDIACQTLIGAIGQQVDTSFNTGVHDVQGNTKLELERWGTVKVNEKTLETSIPGIFAGGDAVTGPDTAINAIAQGKQAAAAIDSYLSYGRAETLTPPFLSFKHQFSQVIPEELAHVPKAQRNRLPELPMSQRLDNFNEVEQGYTCSVAQSEANRCIQCGCAEYDQCQLRHYADQFNVDITPYLGETRKYKIDSRHPYIALDPNKCIQCGRCVRTCSEILKVSALGFINRGFKSIVKPAMDKPLQETGCINCGNCIDTCPTGALSEKLPFKVLGTLPKIDHLSICNGCSIGCHINVKVMNRDIFYISNTPERMAPSHNDGYLCVKGRFGHRYLMDRQNRLTNPQIKSGDTYNSVDWHNAVQTITSRVQDVIDRHGTQAVAVFGSPKMSNEELYLLQKFARVGLKTNNIDSFTHLSGHGQLDALDTAMGVTASTASLTDIDDADMVVVLNGNLSAENLVMEMKIKQARKKHGTKLVLVNSCETSLTRHADLWIDSRKGTNTILINGILKHLIYSDAIDSMPARIPGFYELSDMVADYTEDHVSRATGIALSKYRQLLQEISLLHKKIVFIYHIDSTLEKSNHDLKAIANLLLLTNRLHNRQKGGMILLRNHANSAGLLEMGVRQDYLPGFVKPFETKEIEAIGNVWGTDLSAIFHPCDTPLKQRLLQGQIKAMLVFGEDPLMDNINRKYFKHLEFLMVQDLFPTATTAEADIIIPAATFMEQEGSFTSCDRRIQQVKAAIKPKAGMENLEFLQMLSKGFGLTTSYPSAFHVSSEIRAVNRLHLPIKGNGNLMEHPLKAGCFNKEGQPVFSVYPEDTTPFKPQSPQPLAAETRFREMQMNLNFRN